MAASPEHQEQCAYFQWARLHHKARRAFAIPNGGMRSKATAGKLKAEGVRAGVLDIMLPVACGGAHGLWIEMKAGKNTLSANQADEVADLVADGYAVAVCWSAGDAIEITKSYLNGDFGPGSIFLKPATVAATSRSVRRVRPSS